jgi:hypothetical protein
MYVFLTGFWVKKEEHMNVLEREKREDGRERREEREMK